MRASNYLVPPHLQFWYYLYLHLAQEEEKSFRKEEEHELIVALNNRMDMDSLGCPYTQEVSRWDWVFL